MCIGRNPAMYFTEEMAAVPCRGDRMLLRNFWCHSANGNLDAEICRLHAGMFVKKYPQPRFYLTQKIKEFMCGGDQVRGK